ncbi:MAG: thioredoxin domain-containing protein [Candidatus Aenigmarchaeota archaeon]|nr:thioredoxin domain-containing protein [Candidatus Aenigmarchaeota archaeon]
MNVNWFDWGSDAFERARAENKLVLLDITASWCHWCHVMDSTTYADATVASILNERFVAVRVDTDRRPEVNARYNMGGWPSTVVLTPEGNVITGATYIAPSEMTEMLQKVDTLYKTDKGSLLQDSQTPTEFKMPTGKAGSHLIELYRSWLEELYDNQHGGFGRSSKFPQTNLYGLLFALASEGKGWKDRVVLTLQRMAGGALFDRIEGGFFRYATQRDWSEPHYEKMLYDNARLLSIYARAYVTLGDSLFRKVAEKTADYMTSVLYDSKERYFHGSQDANETYYNLPAAERSKNKAPGTDKMLYTNWNAHAVSAILRASGVLKKDEYKTIALGVLDRLMERCFDGERVYHSYPHDNTTPSTLQDAVALLGALLDAYQYTLDSTYVMKAIDIADYASAAFGSDGALYDIANTEDYGLMAVKRKDADDNGAAARELLKLYTLTGEEKYKTIATNILNELAGLVESKAAFAPQYIEALLYETKGLVEVTLVGDVSELEMLHKSILSKMDERIVIKHEEGKGSAATVCVHETCKGPFENPEALFDALENI